MTMRLRAIEPTDFDEWLPLWEGYNAFYGRKGEAALPVEVMRSTWQRFLDPDEPVFALVAANDSRLVGLAHYLFHRSTNRIEPVCYLQDLFTDPAVRGQGIGQALLHGVYEHARSFGSGRVYWQTQASNAEARSLYDKMAKHSGFIVYAHEL